MQKTFFSLLILLTGCGFLGTEEATDMPNRQPTSITPNTPDDPKTEPEPKPEPLSVEDALTQVKPFVESGARARDLLDLLGILPDYTCGEAQGVFLLDARAHVEAENACARVRLDTTQPTHDLLMVDFDACNVRGRELDGTLTFAFARGRGRFEVSADVSELSIDGETLDGAIGYEKCGDQNRYWATTNVEGVSVSASVAMRPGFPIFGSDTVIVNGFATSPIGQAEMSNVEYKLGKLVPKSGTIIVTLQGHRVRATFEEASFIHNEVEIQIDDKDPVTVPYL